MVETHLIIQSPVYFTKIGNVSSDLVKVSRDIIKVEYYVEFSFTNSVVLTSTDYIVLETNAVINFTSYNFNVGIFCPKNKDVLLYLLCSFQYVNSMSNHKITANETNNKNNFLLSFIITLGICYFLKNTVPCIVTG